MRTSVQAFTISIALAAGPAVFAQNNQVADESETPIIRVFETDLTGFEEVPALSTRANGTFALRLNTQTNSIEYELEYHDFESPVQAAHIHLGQAGVNGGVAITLCSNAATPTLTAQACPTPSGTITGVLQASDVVGPVDQGIAPGELTELAAAMIAGVTYVNVHTQTYPNGEIRGQLLEPDDDETSP